MKWFKRLLGVALLLLIFAIWANMRLSAPVAPTMAEPQSIYLERGEAAQSAYDQLAKISQANGGKLSAFQVKLLATLTGRSSNYNVGEYEFDSKATLSQLLTRLSKGQITQRKIRIAEGVTWREIKQAFAKADLQHDAQDLSDADLVRAVGITEPADAKSIEGLIFPDTYLYRKGEKETSVLKRAHDLLNKKIAELWPKHSPNLPYQTPYEALIMASIVEKETGLDADRPMVAAVFVNRMRKGMPLQTDPTVIYGVGEAFKGDLTTVMMRTDTPYNTYTRAGLTPTPIAMPGKAALRAATQPAKGDALYFVALGDGSGRHVFSASLDAHNAAVRDYVQRYRAQREAAPK